MSPVNSLAQSRVRGVESPSARGGSGHHPSPAPHPHLSSDSLWPWAASLPGMWERTLTIGSAGKSFSATGWKVSGRGSGRRLPP